MTSFHFGRLSPCVDQRTPEKVHITFVRNAPVGSQRLNVQSMRSDGADHLYAKAVSYNYVAARYASLSDLLRDVRCGLRPCSCVNSTLKRPSRRADAEAEGKRHSEIGTLDELVALPLGTVAHGQNRQSSATLHKLTLVRCARAPTGNDSRCPGVDDDRGTQTRPEALVSDD